MQTDLQPTALKKSPLILLLGSHPKEFGRIKALKAGLISLGCEIFEIQEDFDLWLLKTEDALPRASKELFMFTFRLIQRFETELGGRKPDIIWVTFQGLPGILAGSVIRDLTGAKLVFDPMISQFDTHTSARPIFDKEDWMAGWLRMLDRWPCELADVVTMDTSPHADLLSEVTKTPRNKIHVVPMTCSDEIFSPKISFDKVGGPLKVLWYLWVTKLHGLEYVLKAIQTLLKTSRKIEFTLLFPETGSEIERPELMEIFQEICRDPRVHYVKWPRDNMLEAVPLERLSQLLNDHHVSLGCFGGIDKARRVIINKEVEALACGRILVTQEKSSEITELHNGVDCLLVKECSSKEISDTLMFLDDNRENLWAIAEKAHRSFKEQFSPVVVARKFLQAVGI